MRTSSVRFGPVMCGVSDENTTAPPASTGAAPPRGRFREALVAQRFDVGVRERSRSVDAGRDPRAAVVAVASVSATQTRQVLLRLDERVAVVLVPREPPGLLGFLVDRLVPVHVDVGAEEVGTQVESRLSDVASLRQQR